MKNYNLLSKAFVAIVAMLSGGLPTLAHDFEVDGIYYNITDETNKTVEVTSGSSLYSGSVTIPSAVTYNETTYSVTKIGDEAFNDCSGLTEVTIPNSVRLIGSNAFRNCTNLKNANIGNSVTMIGFMAFDGCSSLTSVTIPNSVTTIGTGAFRNCSGLTEVTIPNSVTKIGESTLCHCPGLTSIVVESGNPYYDSRENCNAIIESSTNTLIAGCKNTYIPNSVTAIGDDAFNDCSGLTEVTIPNSVTAIGSFAFRNCTSLTEVNIPNFVTTIGDYAFRGCSGLTSVTIPNSVTAIGSFAFMLCDGLTSVTIPNSVTEIGEYAFDATPWYNNLPNGVVYINNVLYQYKGVMPYNSSIVIKNGTVYISPYAFRDCSGLTSVTIPNSVTAIGSFAFIYCDGLTSIEIPNSVTQIGNSAFYNCQGLTSVTIPNSVTNIGNEAFEGTGWYNNQPDGILYLDNCCLGYKGDKTTGALTLNDGTRLIASHAFFNCNGLTEVTIPNSVTEIGEYAFMDCSRLTEVTSLNPEPPTCGSGAFDGSYSALLNVPEGTKDAYANAVEWEKFTNIQEIAGVEDIDVDNNAVEVGCYDMYGRRLSEPTKGINIIKMSDGSTKKIKN